MTKAQFIEQLNNMIDEAYDKAEHAIQVHDSPEYIANLLSQGNTAAAILKMYWEVDE